MKPRREAFYTMKIKAGIAIGFIFALPFLSGCSADFSVAELKQEYANHKNELGSIVRMVQTDKIIRRIAPTFSKPEIGDGIEAARVEEYRQYLRDANVKLGIEVLGTNRDVYFIYQVKGLTVSGNSRGVAFLRFPPESNVTTNLQPVFDNPTNTLILHEKIEGNWYVWFSHDN